jgi:hypothetical protein
VVVQMILSMNKNEKRQDVYCDESIGEVERDGERKKKRPDVLVKHLVLLNNNAQA